MSEVITTPKAMGGTELLLGNLTTALPELCEQVQIICSRPELCEMQDKPKVLWCHDLANDPQIAKIKDKGYRNQFNRIVFVSHWQQQMFNLFLGLPYAEGSVIKNGVPLLAPKALPKPRVNGKLRFIYTSTPHRGLGVVAAAAEALAKERQDWELHVYSSFDIYGWVGADKGYQPLYDALRANPCVVYHGTQPNAVVRQACLDAHVFVYPSIYQETSCLAIQEAMMAGCLAITTAYGALIETCGEWAWMMPYTENPEHLSYLTLAHMRRALDHYDDSFVPDILAAQSQYFQNFWSFESRVPSWKALLTTVIAEGPKHEAFIVD